MNLIIDKKNIELELKKLNKYINEYNNNVYDVFYELEKLSSYWKDNDYFLFQEKNCIDKKNSLLLVKNLQEVSELYRSACDIYFNNDIYKINYNDENKKQVINKVNNCIEELNVIKNDINNTYIPYDFTYKNEIINLKNNVIKDIKDVDDYKNNLNKFINEINKNEIELLTIINKIDETLFK